MFQHFSDVNQTEKAYQGHTSAHHINTSVLKAIHFNFICTAHLAIDILTKPLHRDPEVNVDEPKTAVG